MKARINRMIFSVAATRKGPWCWYAEALILCRRFLTFTSAQISHLPSLVGLFSSTISILGPLFFKPGGSGMVEAACYNIAAWYHFFFLHLSQLV